MHSKHNKPINSDSKKRRSFVALLFAAGYGQRWARRIAIYATTEKERIMNKHQNFLAIASALIVLAPSPALARNCQAIGNTVFCDDGTSYNKIGNTTFGSDGSSSQKIGDTRFNSDGSSSQQIGNTRFNSDGSSSQRIGNTIFKSDGTSCQIIGNQMLCN